MRRLTWERAFFFNKDVADAREKDREYSRRTLSI